MSLDNAEKVKIDPGKTQNAFPAAVYYVLLPAIILLVAYAYLPVIDNWFHSDDLGFLAYAKQHGFGFSSLFTSGNGHLTPVFRLLLAAEFKLFGFLPRNYYLTSISLHLINTVLAFFVVTKITGNKNIAILSALLFGLSSSHWRTTMWITTQAQLVDACFLFLSIIFFVGFLETRKKWQLLLSAVFHLVAILSFTSGLELFIVLFIVFWIFSDREELLGARIRRGVIVISPYIINVIIYWGLRAIFDQQVQGPIGGDGGATGALFKVPQAIGSLFGGIFFGHLASFGGAWNLNTSGHNIFRIVLGLAILLILANWSKNGIRKNGRILLLFSCWTIVFYLLPSWIRAENGFDWFLSRARYRYLTCLPAAAFYATMVISTYPFTVKSRLWRFARLLVIPWILWFSYINYHQLGYLEYTILESSTREFKETALQFTQRLRLLTEKLERENIPRVQILDKPFAEGAGFNVRPSSLATIYYDGDDLQRIRFISSKESADYNPTIPLLGVAGNRFIPLNY